MSFASRLATGGFPIVLEITPPRRANAAILLRRARGLGASVDCVNVIQREGRWPSLDAAIELAGLGIDAVWNLANRGRTREAIARDLDRAGAAGLVPLLCVRGDHDARDAPDTPKLFEVVRMARERIPAAVVGATFNQYAPRERVLANLAGKVDAGAAFVQTQPVLAVEPFAEATAELQARWPALGVVAMVMPLVSLEEAERIRMRLGVPLPARLEERLRREGTEAGWDEFSRLVAGLVRDPHVSGLAVMTPRMDPVAEYRARLTSALGPLHQTRLEKRLGRN